MNRYSLAAGAIALSVLLAACSSSSKSGGTSSAPSAPGASTPAASTSASTSAAPASGGIVISSFAFGGTLTVKPGEKVTVTNKDSTSHTLTDKGGKFDTGSISGGGTGTFTAPTVPGSYQLKCKFHSQMSGTLVVK